MNKELNEFVLLTSVPNEQQSALIVCTLNDQGIEAKTEGEFTAGFKAEAPGDVKIFVRAEDAVMAKSILEDSSKQFTDEDWENIDVGEEVD